MCSISGSFDLDKLQELYELNAYRGVVSSSISAFIIKNSDTKLISCTKIQGKITQDNWARVRDLETELLSETETNEDRIIYFLCHSQAPTTSSELSESIHPAISRDWQFRLWHNGILKTKTIDTLNTKYGTEHTWDTALLNKAIYHDGWEILNEIDGSFACVFHDASDIYVFRNEISPLFIDNELNISSTKFDRCSSLLPNRVFCLDIANKELVPTEEEFVTKDNPYYMPT